MLLLVGFIAGPPQERLDRGQGCRAGMIDPMSGARSLLLPQRHGCDLFNEYRKVSRGWRAFTGTLFARCLSMYVASHYCSGRVEILAKYLFAAVTAMRQFDDLLSPDQAIRAIYARVAQ
jgi:hypothetical protein